MVEGRGVAHQTGKRQSTMSDIAHLTEVSRMTVSFMLNNHASCASVSSETKEHIRRRWRNCRTVRIWQWIFAANPIYNWLSLYPATICL